MAKRTGRIDTVPTAPIRIVKGLDIPVAGAPEQAIGEAVAVGSVALLGRDHIGLRPHMLVEEGARVRRGQALFADRRNPEILFTAPAAGVVRAVNRGARRALVSVVIDLDGDDEESFEAWPAGLLPGLARGEVAGALLKSGLWPTLRARPFGHVAEPGGAPASIFVTAMDSNPLAARAEIVIDAYRDDFAAGVTAIARLTDGPVFVCHAPGAAPPVGAGDSVHAVAFAGPHPAGLVGTDIVEVAELFVASRFHRFPVMDGGRLAGVISRHDVLRALGALW